MPPDSFTLPGGQVVSINLGDNGATVRNAGTFTVSYSDSEMVRSSPEGTIAPAASVTLYGVQFLHAEGRCEMVVTGLTSDLDTVSEVAGRLVTLEAGRPINVAQQAGATNAAKLTAAIAALPATGAHLVVPRGLYEGSFTITGKDHLTVTGEGSASVIHNATASPADALKLVDCDDVTVTDLRVQGIAGTRDGLRLENCQRANVGRIFCQGSGRHGIYAQRCFGLTIDPCAVGIDTQSPYPTGVANCLTGLYLGWDGSDVTSGCNQFVVNGGQYVVGKSQDWAIVIDHAEGGVINGPIAELSKGGIKLVDSSGIDMSGFYAEFNPTSIEYTAGTASVTNGSATVTGSGTSWNVLDAEGVVVNAAPGKFLIIGTVWARILSVQSNTSLTLEAAWAGSTQAGVAYRIQAVDLLILRTKDCPNLSGHGAGATLFEASSRNKIGLLLQESVFFDAASNYNEGLIVTNRATASASRLVDGSTDQHTRLTQLNYQTGLQVRSDHLRRAGATELRTDADLESTRGVWANIATAAQMVMFTDGRLYWHTSADTGIGRAQAGVLNVGNAVQFTAMAAGSVPNNTVFLDAADNVLKQKNNAGVVSAI